MDTAIQTKTLADFIDTYSITMSCERTYSNPAMGNDEWAKTATHWRCILLCCETGAQMETVFSMGSGLKGSPTKADVLSCLRDDARSIQDSTEFEDWAEDLGYDTDSRKAERIYTQVLAQALKLQQWLGAAGYAALLHTEEEA